MCKSSLNQLSYNGVCPFWVYKAACQIVSTCDDFGARESHKIDYFNVSRLESYCGTGRDVKSFPIGFGTVEGKMRICFDKMIVRSDLIGMLGIEHKYFDGNQAGTAHLDRPIAIVGDAEPDAFSTPIDNDGLFLCNNSTGHLFCSIF